VQPRNVGDVQLHLLALHHELELGDRHPVAHGHDLDPRLLLEGRHVGLEVGIGPVPAADLNDHLALVLADGAVRREEKTDGGQAEQRDPGE
jgi:hypothetical protein